MTTVGAIAALLSILVLASGCAASTQPRSAAGDGQSTPLTVINVPSTAGTPDSAPATPPITNGSSTTPSTSPAASSTTSDAAAIDTAALAGVKAIEAADTRRDHSPRDTLFRATRWLTPAFAARIRSGPETSSATWSTWAKHQAWISVATKLAADDHPVDSASLAYRQVVATLTVTGDHGWKTAPMTSVVFTALRPVDGHWLIDSIQTT